eukprot:TRINITY_DN7747_c0_g1_i2.p1 TRINITY_DN7747_c0_g1~~TRINITY_DN7747_c0_g1_i2.p1  ORF type:complete len:280 (+),score=50.94 TRINITY_DN7747_c0_g1_i2:387-1226(+)
MTAVASTNFPVAAGTSGSLRVQPKDTYGNNVQATGAIRNLLSVSLNPSWSSIKSVIGNEVVFTFTPTIAGVQNAAITYDNQGAINNSPFSLTVNAGALNTSNCNASGEGITSPTTRVQTRLDVTQRDTYGNIRQASEAGWSIQVTPTHFGGTIPTGITLDNTQYFIYIPSKPGATQISVLGPGSVHILGSPFQMNVQQAPTSRELSSLIPATRTAIAGNPIVLKWQARDIYGNLQVQGLDTLSATLRNTETQAIILPAPQGTLSHGMKKLPRSHKHKTP